jgi:hypothetical protein
VGEKGGPGKYCWPLRSAECAESPRRGIACKHHLPVHCAPHNHAGWGRMKQRSLYSKFLRCFMKFPPAPHQAICKDPRNDHLAAPLPPLEPPPVVHKVGLHFKAALNTLIQNTRNVPSSALPLLRHCTGLFFELGKSVSTEDLSEHLKKSRQWLSFSSPSKLYELLNACDQVFGVIKDSHVFYLRSKNIPMLIQAWDADQASTHVPPPTHTHTHPTPQNTHTRTHATPSTHVLS